MRRLLLVCSLLALSSAAFADNHININNLPTQTDFDGLSQDLGAVLTYKQMQGASSEGITGFDVGLNLGDTQVSHKQAWTDATGSSISNLPFADVHISKGLPFGIDIGGMYAFVPSSNIKLYGLEARYAIIDGGITEPAVGLRATYTNLTGVTDLSFHTTSLGVSVSKGIGPVTPYAGVAEVWTNSTPDASTGFTSSNSSNAEIFAGLTFNLGVHLGLEYDHLSGNSSYTLKLGFGF